MIEKINSMLSECQVILDTDADAKPSFLCSSKHTLSMSKRWNDWFSQCLSFGYQVCILSFGEIM
jgi:hypothetical protein